MKMVKNVLLSETNYFLIDLTGNKMLYNNDKYSINYGQKAVIWQTELLRKHLWSFSKFLE